MKRRVSPVVAERNVAVQERIATVKAEHPFWGYRRVWAHLRFTEGVVVNRKRVLRLMRAHNWVVAPNARLRAKRTPTRSKPKPHRPNQWWGIDMTKVLVEPEGWLYLVLVLDWYTKKIVGWQAGTRSTGQEWLQALEMGLHQQFPNGVREQGLCLMSDNGCQPTGNTFMKACQALEVTQAFTSYNNPKGNADTERLMRTLKEELIWLREWRSHQELQEALATWVEQYNAGYHHSALGYKTPTQFEDEYQSSHLTQFAAA